MCFVGAGGGERKDSETPEGLCQGNVELKATYQGFNYGVGSRTGKNSVITLLAKPNQLLLPLGLHRGEDPDAVVRYPLLSTGIRRLPASFTITRECCWRAKPSPRYSLAGQWQVIKKK